MRNTLPETNSKFAPEKWMLGRLLSFSGMAFLFRFHVKLAGAYICKWKITPESKGNDHLSGTHFPLNHDCGRKNKSIMGTLWYFVLLKKKIQNFLALTTTVQPSTKIPMALTTTVHGSNPAITSWGTGSLSRFLPQRSKTLILVALFFFYWLFDPFLEAPKC